MISPPKFAVCCFVLLLGAMPARANDFAMSPQEKQHAAYMQVINKNCDITHNKTGKDFWANIRKRAGVKTKKVGVRKKQLPSGNVDHVSVYKTTGFDKVYDAIGPIADPLWDKSCKALYKDAQSKGLWQIYYPPISFKNGKIQKPKKPPHYLVRVDGKIYASVNPDGVITYAKDRDTLYHKAMVRYKIAIGDLEIMGKPPSSSKRSALKNRYTQHEIQLIAFADILGQQCKLKMTKTARKTYRDIKMRSVEYGEKDLNVIQREYYRLRAADHNPLVYKIFSIGGRDTYDHRPGDGLHLLVNDVINGIYRQPCDAIIKQAKSRNIYETLYGGTEK